MSHSSSSSSSSSSSPTVLSALNSTLIQCQWINGLKEIKLLCKIFNNILNQPQEVKYQKLTPKIKSKLSSASLQLLLTVGFESREDGYLILKQNWSACLLADILEFLFLEQASHQGATNLDPFATLERSEQAMLVKDYCTNYQQIVQDRYLRLSRINPHSVPLQLTPEAWMKIICQNHAAERDRALTELAKLAQHFLEPRPEATPIPSLNKAEICPNLSGCRGAIPLLLSLGLRLTHSLCFLEEGANLDGMTWLAEAVNRQTGLTQQEAREKRIKAAERLAARARNEAKKKQRAKLAAQYGGGNKNPKNNFTSTDDNKTNNIKKTSSSSSSTTVNKLMTEGAEAELKLQEIQEKLRELLQVLRGLAIIPSPSSFSSSSNPTFSSSSSPLIVSSSTGVSNEEDEKNPQEKSSLSPSSTTNSASTPNKSSSSLNTTNPSCNPDIQASITQAALELTFESSTLQTKQSERRIRVYELTWKVTNSTAQDPGRKYRSAPFTDPSGRIWSAYTQRNDKNHYNLYLELASHNFNNINNPNETKETGKDLEVLRVFFGGHILNRLTHQPLYRDQHTVNKFISVNNFDQEHRVWGWADLGGLEEFAMLGGWNRQQDTLSFSITFGFLSSV